MMRRRTVVRACVPLLVCALTLACGMLGKTHSVTGTAHPATKVLDAGGVKVLTETEEFTGFAAGAGIFGKLRILGGSCVGFGGPIGHGARVATVLLVFPAGTSVTGSGRDLVIHTRGRDLHLGDLVDGGSRTAGEEPLSSFGNLASQVPKACGHFKARAFDLDG
jgi:hypothetical protein